MKKKGMGGQGGGGGRAIKEWEGFRSLMILQRVVQKNRDGGIEVLIRNEPLLRSSGRRRMKDLPRTSSACC